MALAVFISATSAYLTMTVFARSFASFIAAHQWEVWLLILLPIVYGVTFAFLTEAYSGHNVASAFVASATVFVIMAIIGTVTKKRPESNWFLCFRCFNRLNCSNGN